MPDARVIVALDFPRVTAATALVELLDPSKCRLKVGKELFVSAGPQFIETLRSKNFDVFLDLKFHDIPDTVAAACRAAADLGVWMVNVHAMGGLTMMQAASEAVAGYADRPLLTAVTILTSMDQHDLRGIGITGEVTDSVDLLAALAEAAGADGVICSAREANRLSAARRRGFILVTPGIRPACSEMNDQKRVMTPAKALAAGASYLVIGRPITRAADPPAVLEQVINDLQG